MTEERALAVWKSVQTSFVLFLVIVPLVLLLNAQAEGLDRENWGTAFGVIAVAGVIAEVFRRGLNHLAGNATCRWGPVR